MRILTMESSKKVEDHLFEKVDSKWGQSATSMVNGLGRTSDIALMSRAAGLLTHLQNIGSSVSKLGPFPSNPFQVACQS